MKLLSRIAIVVTTALALSTVSHVQACPWGGGIAGTTHTYVYTIPDSSSIGYGTSVLPTSLDLNVHNPGANGTYTLTLMAGPNGPSGSCSFEGGAYQSVSNCTTGTLLAAETLQLTFPWAATWGTLHGVIYFTFTGFNGVDATVSYEYPPNGPGLGLLPHRSINFAMQRDDCM